MASQHIAVPTGTSDLLSDLPLDIRTQILSCISSLTAVQTSALSSDWKESWMKCFRIYLEDKPPCDDNERLASFGSQLMRSLQVVGGPLEKFCATFRLPRQVPLDQWVGMAVSRHIHELVLEVDELQLPASFFSCTSLVKLRLRVHKFIGEWQNDCLVCLPRLTTIDSSAHAHVASRVISIINVAPLLNCLKLYDCCYLHRNAPVLKPLLSLTSLEFLGVNRRGLKNVFYVLNSCPTLNHLSFGKLGDSDWESGGIPRSLIECLRTLEVKDPQDLCGGPDREALYCIMENARRLKTLRVSYNKFLPSRKLQMIQKTLQTVGRNNMACEISIFYKNEVYKIESYKTDAGLGDEGTLGDFQGLKLKM